MTDINQARILIIASNGFEQSELEVPRDDLRQAGAHVDVATPMGEPIWGWQDKDWGDEVPADLSLADADARSYDALVIPGGQMNPDTLRVDAEAMKLVRAFLAAGKVVAAICHGPWLLVEAGAVKGRRVTSYKSIKTDVVNAGGQWVDQSVVADGGIVTSRAPGDLPDFVAKIVEELRESRHPRRAA
jgi:protease I